MNRFHNETMVASRPMTANDRPSDPLAPDLIRIVRRAPRRPDDRSPLARAVRAAAARSTPVRSSRRSPPKNCACAMPGAPHVSPVGRRLPRRARPCSPTRNGVCLMEFAGNFRRWTRSRASGSGPAYGPCLGQRAREGASR